MIKGSVVTVFAILLCLIILAYMGSCLEGAYKEAKLLKQELSEVKLNLESAESYSLHLHEIIKLQGERFNSVYTAESKLRDSLSFVRKQIYQKPKAHKLRKHKCIEVNIMDKELLKVRPEDFVTNAPYIYYLGKSKVQMNKGDTLRVWTRY